MVSFALMDPITAGTRSTPPAQPSVLDGVRTIAVEGLVRSGKTRLAGLLAEKFAARLIADDTANPFLPEFQSAIGQNESPFALKAQLIFLLNRFAQQDDIRQPGLFHKLTVTDYLFARDPIYAGITLGEGDRTVYQKVFQLLAERIAPCDLVIYLQTSFAEMLRRIQTQGSPIERKVPADFWREVFEGFNSYFFHFKEAPLLVVNVERFPFESAEGIDQLVREIRRHKKGIAYYAPAD